MKSPTYSLKSARSLALTLAASGCLMIIGAPLAHATSTVNFLGVASGDASSTDVVVWTRATDSANVGGAVTVTLQLSTDNTFPAVGLISQPLTTTTAAVGDNTCKANITGLTPRDALLLPLRGSGRHQQQEPRRHLQDCSVCHDELPAAFRLLR